MIYGFYTQVPIEHLGVVLFEGKKKKHILSQCGKTFHGSKHILKPLLLTVNNPVKVNWAYLFFSSD